MHDMWQADSARFSVAKIITLLPGVPETLVPPYFETQAETPAHGNASELLVLREFIEPSPGGLGDN